MPKKINKFIFWTPRILAIIFILFLAMFSLDVFENVSGFWPTVLALFMHNIPALILLIILLISWKYEIVGGIVFILFGLFYITFAAIGAPKWYMALVWTLTIAAPAFLVGILFLIGWNNKNK